MGGDESVESSLVLERETVVVFQDEIVKEFLVESYENVDRLDGDLIALEKEPTNRERLRSVFRIIHTIKGSCCFLPFPKMERLTHSGESLLTRLRDGHLLLNREITSALLALIDAVRRILSSIETTGQEGTDEFQSVIEWLTRLRDGNQPTLPGIAPATISMPSPAAEKMLATSLAALVVPMPVIEPVAAPVRDPKPSASAAVENRPSGIMQEPAVGGLNDTNIRVDVGLIDKLVNLVGELVLARNQMLQLTSIWRNSTFLQTSQRLSRITTELQEGVMKTRMQPIGNIFNKFPRMVRDLSIACGKSVDIVIEGEETELDKTLLEAIKDPLTHIIRNAVDHGVEESAERIRHDKPPTGTIFLCAFHEGGQVNLEITDDGRGIDLERVRRKAIERGLVGSDQALRLTEREILHLIFHPGFSTAEKVTTVSGRGVGMDVVKTNIERIGGVVDILSRPGRGTTIKLKIPLTLAIIPALIVATAGDRYAIPQTSLLELVRLTGAKSRFETIQGMPVYRLRGMLLPLVFLHRELEVEPTLPASPDGPIHIAVLKADGRSFGLVIDAIHDTEEIVVKPLSKQLHGIPIFAGATIMGDGKVALILDILGLAQKAGVVAKVRDRKVSEALPEAAPTAPTAQALLLFQACGDRRMAVPLSLVARLEDIPRSQVERTATREVVQYHNRILPLIRLEAIFPPRGEVHAVETAQGSLHVLVFAMEGKEWGLVVDRIIDVIETSCEVQPASQGTGTLGAVVLQQRVTDLLDVPSVIRRAAPRWAETPAVG